MYDPEERSIKIADNLNFICDVKNVSLSQLSAQTGISKSTLSNIMNGVSSPFLHTIFRICDALDITLEELIGDRPWDVGRESGETLTEEEKRLLYLYRHLSVPKKNWLEEALNMLEQYRDP